MLRRTILAALCCVGVLGVVTPTAGASTAHEWSCTANASWSVDLTTATATYTNISCYSAIAEAKLTDIFPELHADAWPGGLPPITRTYNYTPLVGLCAGRLSRSSDGVEGTGALKNDGNFHNLVTLVYAVNSRVTATETTAGTLQNACSPTFSSSYVSWGFEATP